MKIALITIFYLFCPFLIIMAFNRNRFAQKAGTVIIAYSAGIILSVLHIIPAGEMPDAENMKKIQQLIMNLTVPLAIPLMLFGSNFRLWTKSLPKTIIALIGGLTAVVIATVASFFLFKNSGMENLPDIAAMITGIYTGGTVNFVALGSALHVDSNAMTLALTFEMLVTFPFIIFITGGGYKLFRKLLPFPEEDSPQSVSVEGNNFENYHGMKSRPVFLKMMLGFLLSVLFLIIASGISFLITGILSEVIIILTITTFSVAASFNKKIRALPKTFELGMFLILIFSIVVASQFDFYSVNTSSLIMGGFILCVMLLSITLHLLFMRIFGVNGDLYTAASVALLCSPPFVPPVVSAMNNKKVLISGIAIGLVGYAAGTYLGIGVSFLLAYL